MAPVCYRERGRFGRTGRQNQFCFFVQRGFCNFGHAASLQHSLCTVRVLLSGKKYVVWYATVKNGKKEYHPMLSVLRTSCNRFIRHHTAARRLRRKQIIRGKLAELQQLEADLENLVIRTGSPLKKNIALIKMFYADLDEASQHFKSRRYREAKRSRSSARASFICIKRNIEATANDATIQYVVN